MITVVLARRQTPPPPAPRRAVGGLASLMGAPDPIGAAAMAVTSPEPEPPAVATVEDDDPTEVEIPEGESFSVESQMLVVLDKDDKKIAVFAAGTWKYAYPGSAS